MNNEIKELIRDCNELLNDDFFTLNNIEITRHELNLLLDYITNLQQENEKIRKMNMHEHKYGSDMEEKYLIEKNKNDRAIEYIENTPLYETTYDYNMEEELEIQNVSDETASNKLLNILRGKDNE